MPVKCLLCGGILHSLQEITNPQKMICTFSETSLHKWGEIGNNMYRKTSYSQIDNTNQTNLDDFRSLLFG